MISRFVSRSFQSLQQQIIQKASVCQRFQQEFNLFKMILQDQKHVLINQSQIIDKVPNYSAVLLETMLRSQQLDKIILEKLSKQDYKNNLDALFQVIYLTIKYYPQIKENDQENAFQNKIINQLKMNFINSQIDLIVPVQQEIKKFKESNQMNQYIEQIESIITTKKELNQFLQINSLSQEDRNLSIDEFDIDQFYFKIRDIKSDQNILLISFENHTDRLIELINNHKISALIIEDQPFLQNPNFIYQQSKTEFQNRMNYYKNCQYTINLEKEDLKKYIEHQFQIPNKIDFESQKVYLDKEVNKVSTIIYNMIENGSDEHPLSISLCGYPKDQFIYEITNNYPLQSMKNLFDKTNLTQLMMNYNRMSKMEQNNDCQQCNPQIQKQNSESLTAIGQIQGDEDLDYYKLIQKYISKQIFNTVRHKKECKDILVVVSSQYVVDIIKQLFHYYQMNRIQNNQFEKLIQNEIELFQKIEKMKITFDSYDDQADYIEKTAILEVLMGSENSLNLIKINNKREKINYKNYYEQCNYYFNNYGIDGLNINQNLLDQMEFISQQSQSYNKQECYQVNRIFNKEVQEEKQAENIYNMDETNKLEKFQTKIQQKIYFQKKKSKDKFIQELGESQEMKDEDNNYRPKIRYQRIRVVKK